MTYEEIMSITPGGIVPGGFSITPNATYIGPGEPILDAEGNAAPGEHYVNKWDKILVLDIGYTKQLTLIQYPVGNNEVRQGYITNSLSKIEYSDLENNFWQNGSTSETVYLSYSGNTVLGSLDPNERAIFLYKVEDRYNVVYSTDKGPYTKSGFVNYSGGISVQITEGRCLAGGGSSINNIPAGGIVPGGRTYPVNAVVKFDSLYIRDENGNVISGRETSIGDEITVLDISFSKQLALIQYPSGGNIRQGYVTNNTKIINYINPYQWVNGSSTETVYLDSECTKKFGIIDAYESATLLYKKDGVYCVAYDAPGNNGGMDMLNKCGFVRFAGNKPQATPSANELLYQGFANNVEKISYGTSPAGYPLNIYKIGTGNNVLFANFAIHGFEDDWNHDGTALVHIANELIRKISVTSDLYGWTVYINNCANPDGTFNGVSKDGPGRCTVSTRIDMNRCFPYNFSPMANTRNYTGGTALGAPEAQALHDIVLKINREKMNGSNEMVVIDFHGWMGMTQGNPVIGQYFNNKFGYGSTINQYSAGFFSAWAQASLKDTRGLLVEYPKDTRSIAQCNNDDYIGKTYRGIMDLLSSNKGSSNSSNSNENLSIGDKGEAVKDLQAKLAYIGYPIVIDGIFGEQTLTIVKQFQKNNGLYVDGIVGKQTMNKLDELVKHEEQIKPDDKDPNTGVQVDEIIKALKELENISNNYISKMESPLPAFSLFFGYLRLYRYNSTEWELSLGVLPVDKRIETFAKYIEDNYKNINNILMPYIRYNNTQRFNLYGTPIKLAHLAATILGYDSSPVPDFWTGWGGDLATAMVDTKNLAKKENISEDVAAMKVVGAPNNGSSFSYEDILTDIDAITLSKSIDNLNIVNSLLKYYKNINNLERRNVICKSITHNENPELEMLYSMINNKITGLEGFKLGIFGKYPLRSLAGNPSQELVNYTTMAFAKYIFSRLK